MAQAFQVAMHANWRMMDYTPSAAVAAGAVVVQGVLPGVALQAMEAGRKGALCIEGPCRAVKVNGQITAGARVYWDENGSPQGGEALSGAITTNSALGEYFGIVTETAEATDEYAECIKAPHVTVSNTVHNPTSNLIEDPGDAGHIGGSATAVPDSGYCPLVSTGAETRHLPIPTYAGQQLLICMHTDGGNITLTGHTALNQAGNNTAVFNDAGDSLLLIAVYVGAALAWRIVANDTVALSTV